MSYDVQVYAQRALDVDELSRLLAEAGLAAEDTGSGTESSTVVRGVRARYCFTLGRPVPVEAEDVPEEVTAALLGPSYLYELLVEGSSTTEIAHAVRFARRLARAAAGVVLDLQTGQVRVGGKLRAAPPVQRGVIDVVELEWYVPPGGAGGPAAGAWLELARRYLPEALPRRFGSYEPLPMKLDVDGPGMFVQAAAAETMLLFYKAAAPCIGGSMAGGARGRGVHSHGLSVHREALADPRWRAALRRLFVEFAAATDAVFACAEVRRGVEWSGRTTWFGPTTERSTYLAAGGRWAGLLPYPAWWSWFGPDYAPLVLDHLPAEQVVHVDGGIFHPRGEEPLDRDQLTAALGSRSTGQGRRKALGDLWSRRVGRAPAPTWLPADLLPVEDDSDPREYIPPLVPAPTIPAGLRAHR